MPTKKPPVLTPKARSRAPLHLQAKGVRASSGELRNRGRKLAAQSRAPLTRQDESTSWYERQARLAAARDAVRAHLMASYKRGAGDKRRAPLPPDWRG